jgi:hypothetical protein
MSSIKEPATRGNRDIGKMKPGTEQRAHRDSYQLTQPLFAKRIAPSGHPYPGGLGIRVKPSPLCSLCFLLLNLRIRIHPRSVIIRVNPTKSGLKFKTQHPSAHSAFPPSVLWLPKRHPQPLGYERLQGSANRCHRGIPTRNSKLKTRNFQPAQAPRNQHQSHPLAPGCSRGRSATGIELPRGRKRHRMPSMSPLRHCQNQLRVILTNQN